MEDVTYRLLQVLRVVLYLKFPTRAIKLLHIGQHRKIIITTTPKIVGSYYICSIEDNISKERRFRMTYESKVIVVKIAAFYISCF